MKKTIITIVIIVAAIIILILVVKKPAKVVVEDQNPSTIQDTTNMTNSTSTQGTSTQNTALTNGAISVIGKSVGGRDIDAYHYGTGTTQLLFVGGIHGGYEWNTALVAYELIDYLEANPTEVPANISVTVIPVLNPDGLYEVVGTTTGNITSANVSKDADIVISGRFNGNNVDLNRNFDCDWQTTGKWQSKTVSGGSAAFSEPESQAMKTYIETNKPTAVVVWYSAAGGVYASNCHKGVSAETSAIMNAYAGASGYPANESFDFYSTTGDMTNWLAKIGTPAISVLLTNHTDTEWSKNLAGFKALIKHYLK